MTLRLGAPWGMSSSHQFWWPQERWQCRRNSFSLLRDLHFQQIWSQGHVTNENHYIFTTRVPTTAKIGKVIAFSCWIYNHMIFWIRVTNYDHYISSTTVSMAIKLGRMVRYLGWAPNHITMGRSPLRYITILPSLMATSTLVVEI